MKAGHKFLLGAALIVAERGLPHRSGRARRPGSTSSRRASWPAKTTADPTFYDVGLKMGAKVVPGSIRRDDGAPAGGFPGHRRGQDLPRHLPRPRARYLHRRERHRSRSWKAGSAATASSAPPRCSPSAAPATRPRPKRPRPSRMTLLGQFSLWIAFLLGHLGARSSPSPGAGRTGPSSRASVYRSRLRDLRRAAGRLASRCGRGSPATTSTSSTWPRTPPGTFPTRYIFSAFWAGQKGSLLFWAVVLSLFAALAQLLTAAAVRAR